jgi:hypothetical protein
MVVGGSTGTDFVMVVLIVVVAVVVMATVSDPRRA